MKRILYISTARKTLLATELEDILRLSRRNNTAVGVTGMLVVGGRRFLQMLEGTEQAVDSVFERIQRDPRHFAVVTLSSKLVDHRLTPEWAMGFAGGLGSDGAASDLPAIVGRMVAAIDDPLLKAEFTQFALRHAA